MNIPLISLNMIKTTGFRRKYMHLLRKFATQHKPVVSLDEDVDESIKKEIFKPRRHPGVVTPKAVQVPENFIKAVHAALEDYPVKALLANAQVLVRHLKNRVPPMEEDDLRDLKKRIRGEVIGELGEVNITSEEDENILRQSIKDKVLFRMKKIVYNWKSVDYTEYNALTYLLGRFAPEHAVLTKIFSEIKLRDERFKPRSFFDFGSGVGSAMWVASALWGNSLLEYFNVDSSSAMNDLSQVLLQGGRGNKESHLKGVYYRQFLPASNTSYDLVVSAYSLLELPSTSTRIDTLINLWNKTEKYLVLVEYGTNGGFRVINEARDFILQITDEHNRGHVFSPCPHDYQCPRFANVDDNTPCNFPVKYHTLPIGGQSEVQTELCSYVILKKGARDPNDKKWPRLVRETLIRTRHTICRMCTHEGKLEEVIFTAAKHGKTTYHCGRFTKWGDLLPIKIEDSK